MLASYIVLALFFDIALEEIEHEPRVWARILSAALWPVLVTVSIFIKIMERP